MREARLSAQARADLEEVWLYIGQDSPVAADRFIDRILQACQKLAVAPRIGRSHDDLGPVLRSLPVDKYIVFYRPSKSGIEVARVLSGYRDIEALFDP
jgi:toxin ParE1/3/4